MSTRLSRRKLAAYTADKLMAGESLAHAIKEAAAYLVDTGRTREQELLVRDIEDSLAERGLVIADVTSAHPLTSTLKAQISEMVGSNKLEFRERIDPDVLGGVQVDIPGKRFDGTLRHKIHALKAKQL